MIKKILLMLSLFLFFTGCGDGVERFGAMLEESACPIKTSQISNGMNGGTANTYWRCDKRINNIAFFESGIGAYTPYAIEDQTRIFEWFREDCNGLSFKEVLGKDGEISSYGSQGRILLLEANPNQIKIGFQFEEINLQTTCELIRY